MADKKPTIEELTREIRTHWAHHPELFALLHRNPEPLAGRKPNAEATLLLDGASVVCQLDFPIRRDGAKPFIIDYCESINFKDLQAVTHAEMEALVLKVMKARVGAGNHDIRFIDSMGELEHNQFIIGDLKCRHPSGDPLRMPDVEDRTPVKKGFKLKPNATGMYRQFVDRNHKR